MPDYPFHRKIRQFVQRYEDLGYGEDHLLFACHAAFPTGVTSHMLYQIWANFSIIPDQHSPMDPVVVSDFLLSNLCRKSSLGIYEIKRSYRMEFLDYLEKDPRFGKKRLRELAYFLYQYIQESAQEQVYDVFRETQYWTAISVIAPEKAAQEIANRLGKHINEEDQGEILRINGLLENIAPQEGRFENLLYYSRGLKEGILEKPQAAKEAFSKVMVVKEGGEAADASFTLEIPVMKSVIKEDTLFSKLPGTAERIFQERVAQFEEEGQGRLDLSGIEGLKTIPEEILQLKGLRELIINGSDLEIIPDFLRALENLEVLMLRHNQIRTVPSGVLPLGSLRVLDLGHNQLESIDPAILSAPLENLNFSHNQLKILPPTLLDNQETTTYLELDANPWINLPTGNQDNWVRRILIELVNEHWQQVATNPIQFKLIEWDSSQGELYLDVQDLFRYSIRNGDLQVEIQQAFFSYDLFHYLSPRNLEAHEGIPILYLNAERFELSKGEGDKTPVFEPLLPEELAALLAPLASITEVVVLNIGDSALYAGALLQAGFKGVIAANNSLSFEQRQQFQEAFFVAIADGSTLREAFDSAASAAPQSPLDFAPQQQSPQQQSTQQSYTFEPEFTMQAWQVYEGEGPKANWDWFLPVPAEDNSGDLDNLKNNLKNEIIKTISRGEYRVAFALLNDNLVEGSSWKLELTLLMARFGDLERKRLEEEGSVTTDSYDLEVNRIINDYINLLDEIPSNEINPSIELPESEELPNEAAEEAEDPTVGNTEFQKSLLIDIANSVDLSTVIQRLLEQYTWQGVSDFYNLIILYGCQLSRVQKDYKQGFITKKVFDVEWNRIRSGLIDLIDDAPTEIPPEGIERMRDVSARVEEYQHQVVPALLEDNIEEVFIIMDPVIAPRLSNFEYFLFKGRYQRYQLTLRNLNLDSESLYPQYNKLMNGIISYLADLNTSMFYEGTLEDLIKTKKDYLVFTFLQKVAQDAVKEYSNSLQRFFKDDDDLAFSIGEVHAVFSEIEKEQLSGASELENANIDLNQNINDLKEIIERGIKEEDIPIELLDGESLRIEGRIRELEMQKSIDPSQMETLQTEHKIVQALLSQNQVPTDLFQVYDLISKDDLLGAIKGLKGEVNENNIQRQAILDNLENELKSFSEKPGVDYNSYGTFKKIKDQAKDHLLKTLDDLKGNLQKHSDQTRDPDLLNYVRQEVVDLMEEGQVKNALGMLIDALDLHTDTLEDIVQISYEYYATEGAQQKEWIDYREAITILNQIAEQIEQFTSRAEFFLKAGFAQQQLEKVRQEMQSLQGNSKRKSFNIRRDGRYQQLQAAESLLRKFVD